MSLKLSSIANAGDFDRERVVLIADSETEIGEYAIFQCRSSSDPGQVLSGRVLNAYWFENKKVKAGDYVVVYTKRGTRSEKVNSATGSTAYFYYWGLGEPIWNPGVTPVLVETPNWKSGKPIIEAQGKTGT